MEMQSVTHNISEAMPVLVRIGRAARRCGILAWLALIALPHGVLAQDLSANARLLAAARTGDETGVGKALADGASANARNRVGETALVIALKNDRPTLAMTMPRTRVRPTSCDCCWEKVQRSPLSTACRRMQ
jgi:ankyrin repeat protein